MWSEFEIGRPAPEASDTSCLRTTVRPCDSAPGRQAAHVLLDDKALRPRARKECKRGSAVGAPALNQAVESQK